MKKEENVIITINKVKLIGLILGLLLGFLSALLILTKWFGGIK